MTSTLGLSINDSRTATDRITSDNRIDNRVDNRITTDNRVDNSIVKIKSITLASTATSCEGDERIRQQKVLEWISPITFHDQQLDIFSKRTENTGGWFLKGETIKGWIEGGTKMVFCEGIPGAGKSILASTIINDLERTFASETSVAIAYIYCNYKLRDQYTASALVRSLCRQLISSASRLLGELDPRIVSIFDQCKSYTTFPLMEVIEAVIAAISCFSNAFVVVDALDEIADEQRDSFLVYLHKLVSSREHVGLLAMARPSIYLAEWFAERGAMQMSICADEGDLERHIQTQLETREELLALNRGKVVMGEEIKAGVIGKARGMFLLAQFHLDAVATASSEKEARSLLDKLPTGINATYAAVIDRIKTKPEKYLKLAKRVLMWIAYAKGPLTITELQHALAVPVNTTSEEMDLEECALILQERIISSCAGLVVMDNESQVVRLVHYTTQDYVHAQTTTFIDPAPHIRISAACVNYLCFPKIFDLFWANSERYSLTIYAARHWADHAREQSNTHHSKMIVEFLSQEETVFEAMNLKSLYEAKYQYFPSRYPIRTTCYPLEAAVWFRLYNATKLLIDAGASTNQHRLHHPLESAIGAGDVALTQLLLENGADMHQSKRNVFRMAAEGGSVDLVRLLLANGANVDSDDGEKALCGAAKGGHHRVVCLLLENGAQANKASSRHYRSTRAGYPYSPLHLAASSGSVETVQMLLVNGAEVNLGTKGKFKDYIDFSHFLGSECEPEALASVLSDWKREWHDHDCTPLHIAAGAGHAAVAELLLENGADANLTLNSTRQGELTAMDVAAMRGRAQIVRLLLDRGAPGPWAFLFAANYGHVDIVRMLLDSGTVACTIAARALPLAARQEGVVRMLLDRGLGTGTGLRVALQQAVTGNCLGVVRMLLAAGVDADAGSYLAGPALAQAARHADLDLVELLLQAGARAAPGDPKPLVCAARGPVAAAGMGMSIHEDHEDSGKRERVMRRLIADGAAGMGISIHEYNAMRERRMRRRLIADGAAGMGMSFHEDSVMRERVMRRLIADGAVGMGISIHEYNAMRERRMRRRLIADGAAGMGMSFREDSGMRERVMRRLITDGAAVCADTLLAAARWAGESLMQLLLAKLPQAQPSRAETMGALVEAAAEGGNWALVELFLRMGAGANAATLIHAASSQDIGEHAMRLILGNLSDVDSIESNAACKSSVQEMLCERMGRNAPFGRNARFGRHLLKHEPDAWRTIHCTALVRAAMNESSGWTSLESGWTRTGCVKLLLEHGASKTSAGVALFAAAVYRNLEVARLLLEAPTANIGINDLCCQAAFMFLLGGLPLCGNMINHEFSEIELLLLKRGLDPTEAARVCTAQPPLIAIGDRQAPNVALKLLQSANVNINEVYGGLTPLISAVRSGNVAFVKILLEHGADPNLTAGREEMDSPLGFAAADNRNVIVDILLKAGARIYPATLENARARNKEDMVLYLTKIMESNAKSDHDTTAIATEDGEPGEPASNHESEDTSESSDEAPPPERPAKKRRRKHEEDVSERNEKEEKEERNRKEASVCREIFLRMPWLVFALSVFVVSVFSSVAFLDF